MLSRVAVNCFQQARLQQRSGLVTSVNGTEHHGLDERIFTFPTHDGRNNIPNGGTVVDGEEAGCDTGGDISGKLSGKRLMISDVSVAGRTGMGAFTFRGAGGGTDAFFAGGGVVCRSGLIRLRPCGGKKILMSNGREYVCPACISRISPPIVACNAVNSVNERMWATEVMLAGVLQFKKSGIYD
jgi:hypothetical protein